MTDTELIEAVAKQLGWTKLSEAHFKGRCGSGFVLIGTDPTGVLCKAPAWLTSLDAAQEVMETLLDETQCIHWTIELKRIIHDAEPRILPKFIDWNRFNASPRQRIEAFVKVIKSEVKG